MKIFFTLLLSHMFLVNLVAVEVKLSEPKIIRKDKETLREISKKKTVKRELLNDKLPKTQFINKKYKLKLNNVIFMEKD